MSVILRDVLITEVVERRSKRLMIAVVSVFGVMTAPLAVALPTTIVLRGSRLPAFVVYVVWILQLLRTLAHPLLYGVCNTMVARAIHAALLDSRVLARDWARRLVRISRDRQNTRRTDSV